MHYFFASIVELSLFADLLLDVARVQIDLVQLLLDPLELILTLLLGTVDKQIEIVMLGIPNRRQALLLDVQYLILHVLDVLGILVVRPVAHVHAGRVRNVLLAVHEELVACITDVLVAAGW